MRLDYQGGINISAEALSAYRRWMDTIAENLANAQTTRTPSGGPYRRKEVVFQSVEKKVLKRAEEAPTGLPPAATHPRHIQPGSPGPATTDARSTVRAIVREDQQTPFVEVYDPGHPDADASGMVKYPNVNPVVEMVNLIMAARAYEANIAALKAQRRMQESALGIGK